MKCSICGKENPDDSVFCLYCGARIEHNTTESTSVQEEADGNESDKSGEEKVGYYFANLDEFLIYAKVEAENSHGKVEWLRGDKYTSAFKKGFALVDAGNMRDAVAWFNKAISCNPVAIDARFELINCYLGLKELDAALGSLHYLERYLCRSKDIAHYYRSYGYYFVEKQDYKRGAAAYKLSLKYDMNLAGALEMAAIQKEYRVNLDNENIEQLVYSGGAKQLEPWFDEIEEVKKQGENDESDRIASSEPVTVGDRDDSNAAHEVDNEISRPLSETYKEKKETIEKGGEGGTTTNYPQNKTLLIVIGLLVAIIVVLVVLLVKPKQSVQPAVSQTETQAESDTEVSAAITENVTEMSAETKEETDVDETDSEPIELPVAEPKTMEKLDPFGYVDDGKFIGSSITPIIEEFELDKDYQVNDIHGDGSVMEYILFPDFDYFNMPAGETGLKIDVVEGKGIDWLMYEFIIDSDKKELVASNIKEIYEYIESNYAHKCDVGLYADRNGNWERIDFTEFQNGINDGKDGTYSFYWFFENYGVNLSLNYDTGNEYSFGNVGFSRPEQE